MAQQRVARVAEQALQALQVIAGRVRLSGCRPWPSAAGLLPPGSVSRRSGIVPRVAGAHRPNRPAAQTIFGSASPIIRVMSVRIAKPDRNRRWRCDTCTAFAAPMCCASLTWRDSAWTTTDAGAPAPRRIGCARCASIRRPPSWPRCSGTGTWCCPTSTCRASPAWWRWTCCAPARPRIPFILVSGEIGEDTAVEAMRNGASDYLLKNNLARLVPAVLHGGSPTDAPRARARRPRS